MGISSGEKWLYIGFLRAMLRIMTPEDREQFEQICKYNLMRSLTDSEEKKLQELFRKFDKETPWNISLDQ